MSNEVFPTLIRGLHYESTKTFEFATIVQSSASGVTNRIDQMKNPLWTFTLTYNYLKNMPKDIPAGLTYTDFQTLMGFCLGRKGRFDSFLYNDPSDNFVGPALLVGGAPNLQAQLQVVNDGAVSPTYYSPVQRNFGGQFYEDITDLNGGISVYDNGMAQAGGGTNYTLRGPGGSIPGYTFPGYFLQWTAPPTGPVTAQFFFYFRVAFDMDKRDFDAFMNTILWCLGGTYAGNSSPLTFVTARPT